MIPLNRLVAFGGPLVSIITGGVAAWLASKANVLGLPFASRGDETLAAGVAGTLAAGAMQLGQSQWLKGHRQHMAAEAAVLGAELAALGAAETQPPIGTPDIDNWDIDPDVEAELAEADALEHEDLPDPIDLKPTEERADVAG